MRKLHVLMMFAMLLMSVQAYAQRKVSGTVTGAPDNEPLPGVSVLEKGTSSGTITDIDGNYEITVAGENSVLVFSFVGFETKEIVVGVNAIIDVLLSSGVELDEFVVTALGLSKEKKALGYAVTQISSDEVVKGGERSLLNAIQGKVPGIEISQNSSDPGSSTRFRIRGIRSVSGNNEPLIVVNGVPLTNQSTSSGDELNYNYDFGNAINSINPEDIESISILKGSAASALYGSRAANGVVLITTKKGGPGQDSKKWGVNLNSSVTMSSPLRLPSFQNTFGQGWDGVFRFDENGSWGPKFDGKDRLWGRVVDNSQLVKPFVALEDNVSDFLDLGMQYQNSISINGGNEKSSFYASYSNTLNDGMMPSDVDKYNRNTISLNGSTKNGILRLSGGANYSRTDSRFVPTGQGETVMSDIYQFPRDISIIDHANYEDQFYNIDDYFTQYGVTNPYFNLNEDGTDFSEDKIFGSAELALDFTKYLTFLYRFGYDIYSARAKSWQAIRKPVGPNESVFKEGLVSEFSGNGRQLNQDFILQFNTSPTDWMTIDGFAGYNMNERSSKSLSAAVSELTLPDFYDLSNSPLKPTAASAISKRRLLGVYGQLNLGFKSLFYLNYSARNDWSSTLPAENRSFAYHAVSASWVFSEHLKKQNDWFNFGKVRVGFGTTGTDAPPYSIDPVFIQSVIGQDFVNIDFPLDGQNAYEVSNTIGNAGLKPEFTKEFEVGLELNLLKNRLSVDASYYRKRTTDIIFNVPLAPSSGYTSQVLNAGEVFNQGVELAARVGLLDYKNFKWDAFVNFARNWNEVVKLAEGIDRIGLGGTTQVGFIAVPGQPIGVYELSLPKTSPDGSIVVDEFGVPVPDPNQSFYKNAQHKYTIGTGTSMSFYGVSISALFDIRRGGHIYSRSADLMYFTGNTIYSTYNDRNPFIVPNSVQEVEDDEGNITYVENDVAVDMDHMDDYYSSESFTKNFIFSRSFVKLKELTLSYSLPSKVIDKSPFTEISFNIFGRNLFLWTPEDNRFIDPETSSFGTGIDAEYGEYLVNPSARSYGAGLRLGF